MKIKYRAWTKEFKVLYPMVILKNEFNLYDFEDEDFVWQQIAGFKDKNGKEIYVGDYIKYLGKTYQVIQDFTGAFAGKNKEFGEKSLFICYIYTECEVVGNIYQTLEEN